VNVVADSNAVISAIFWPGESRECFVLWARRRFQLAVTVPLFAEYCEVAQRVGERIPAVNPAPWLKWIERNTR
jgi:predicted nucleic acid-binding protein